jgi:hypothetical protein
MFSERHVPKVRCLQNDSRASVLVTNIPSEPGRWVSLEGRVVIIDCQELKSRLRIVQSALQR